MIVGKTKSHQQRLISVNRSIARTSLIVICKKRYLLGHDFSFCLAIVYYCNFFLSFIHLHFTYMHLSYTCAMYYRLCCIQHWITTKSLHCRFAISRENNKMSGRWNFSMRSCSCTSKQIQQHNRSMLWKLSLFHLFSARSHSYILHFIIIMCCLWINGNEYIILFEFNVFVCE